MTTWNGPPINVSVSESYKEPKRQHFALISGFGKYRKVEMIWDSYSIPFVTSLHANVIIAYDVETMDAWVMKNRFGKSDCPLDEVDCLDDDVEDRLARLAKYGDDCSP